MLGCMGGASDISAAGSSPALISPALSVIAEDSGMAMAGVIGNDISFEAQDFARAMNVSRIDSITVTEAPATEQGELRVGNTVVCSGQTVSRSGLDRMTYVPASADSTRATFRFRLEGAGYDMPCELYLLSEQNHAPTLEAVPPTCLNVSTHRNVALFGTLPCYDAEGDKTIIEIVSYPREGSLELTDKYSGEYIYTPASGYSGKDKFSYVARDIYGNYSAASTVTLNVTRPTVSVKYDDIQNTKYYNSALTMAEEGIMSGTQVGSCTYFYPDKTVSRGEFVVMALHAAGVEQVPASLDTGFADDGDIPEHMKGYVATACRLGYIKGVPTESGVCFEANRAITRAEAAVMLSGILGLEMPDVLPTFSDSADIPAWASGAVYSLAGAGVMTSVEGSISPTAALTRGDAAITLNNLMNYLE